MWMAIKLLAASQAVCAAPNPRLALREDIRLGAGLSDLVRTTEALPQRKRYFQLLPAEREVIRSWYADMSVADDPPYPESGLAFLLDTLRLHASQRHLQGMLALEVSVSERGEVVDVRVMVTPNADMARAAVYAVKRTPFSPGLCGAIPCAMPFPVAVILRGE